MNIYVLIYVDIGKQIVGPIHKQGAQEIGTAHGYKKPKWADDLDALINSGMGFLNEDGYYKQRSKKITTDGVAAKKLGPTDVGKNKYKGTKYTDNDHSDFLKAKHLYNSSVIVSEYDASWTKLMTKLPKEKLNILKQQEPPTGYHTKLAWIKKLRELVHGEIKTNKGFQKKLKNSKSTMKLIQNDPELMKGLQELDDMIDIVENQQNNDNNNDNNDLDINDDDSKENNDE